MTQSIINRTSLLVAALVVSNVITDAFVPPNPLTTVNSPSTASCSFLQQRQKQPTSLALRLQNDKYIDLTKSSSSTTSSTSLKEGTDLEDAAATTAPAVKQNLLWDDENDAGVYKTAIRRTLYWVGAAIGYGFLLIFFAATLTFPVFNLIQ